MGQNAPGCPIVYTIVCFEQDYPGIHVYEYNYDLTRELKISESVIWKWEIGTYLLVLHPVTYGLFPCLCNYKKTDIRNVQIQPRSVKYEMGIHRRDQMRWIGDMILIHLGTFNIQHVDILYVRLRGCLICCQFYRYHPPLKCTVNRSRNRE